MKIKTIKNLFFNIVKKLKTSASENIQLELLSKHYDKLNKNEKDLLVLIKRLTIKYKVCYASNRYLAEKLGLSTKTIQRYINKYKKYDIIYVKNTFFKCKKQRHITLQEK